MKGKFNVYLTLTFGKKLIFPIVAWFTVRGSMVCIKIQMELQHYFKPTVPLKNTRQRRLGMCFGQYGNAGCRVFKRGVQN